MKKRGILNDRINLVIAQLGHTDMLGVSDCGLPIPPGVMRIDISLVKGIPTFTEVVEALSTELVVDKIIVAREMRERNPKNYAFLVSKFSSNKIVEIPHEELKRMLPQLKAIIRTGEATPYSNVIFQSGVDF